MWPFVTADASQNESAVQPAHAQGLYKNDGKSPGEFRAPLNLSHHQDRAGREVNQSIGPAAEHPLVEVRMAGGADHQQIGLKVAGKANDVAYRMPGEEMNM
jgi:hypothetical protein